MSSQHFFFVAAKRLLNKSGTQFQTMKNLRKIFSFEKKNLKQEAHSLRCAQIAYWTCTEETLNRYMHIEQLERGKTKIIVLVLVFFFQLQQEHSEPAYNLCLVPSTNVQHKPKLFITQREKKTHICLNDRKICVYVYICNDHPHTQQQPVISPSFTS